MRHEKIPDLPKKKRKKIMLRKRTQIRSNGSGGHALRTVDYRCTRAFCEKIPARQIPPRPHPGKRPSREKV